MAYKKRKRAEQYDPKLKIKGSFDQAMDVLLGKHKKPTVMSIKLTLNERMEIPNVSGKIITSINYSLDDPTASNTDFFLDMEVTGLDEKGLPEIFKDHIYPIPDFIKTDLWGGQFKPEKAIDLDQDQTLFLTLKCIKATKVTSCKLELLVM